MPYYDTKHGLLSAGLMSCSQVGFNIAIGQLAMLQQQVEQWLLQRQEKAVYWRTPPLLRQDWVVRSKWHNPADPQWCHELPGGFILTPRPLMHLMNRLRHHPQDQGAWVLHGTCVRHETDTLPLYRQRSFTLVEHVWLGGEMQVQRECSAGLMALWRQAEAWDLPVQLVSVNESEETGGAVDDYALAGWPAQAFPLRIMLRIPDLPSICLATAELCEPELLAAYKLERSNMASLGAGIERWCIALLMRYGIDAEHWPRV